MNTQRIRRAMVFKASFILGVVGAVSVISSMAGSALTWRLMRQQSVLQSRMALTESAALVAGQVRLELQHWVQELTHLAQESGRPGFMPAASDATALKADPDLMDLSIWRLPSNPGDTLPERRFLGTNAGQVAPEIEKALRHSNSERRLAQLAKQVFAGTTVLTSDDLDGAGSSLVLGVPYTVGNSKEVILAHLNPQRFSRLLKTESSGKFALVTPSRLVLAHTDPAQVGNLFGKLPGDVSSGTAATGIFEYQHSGATQRAGYRRISLGKMLLISFEDENFGEDSSLGLVLGQTALFAVFCTLMTISVGISILGQDQFPSFRLSRRRKPEEDLSPASQGEADLLDVADLARAAAAQVGRKPAWVLHGGVVDEEALLESLEAEDAVAVFNDFLSIAAIRVADFGGKFEKGQGASFNAFWTFEPGQTPSVELERDLVWRQIRCALELRREFSRLNQARKLDGLKTITFSMGLDSGMALIGRMGPAGGSERVSIAGDVVAAARSLAGFAAHATMDILVSNEVWQGLSQDALLGDQMGEAKLTSHRGLTPYYSLNGYRDEQGHSVVVNMSFDGAPREEITKTEATGTVSQLYFPKRQRNRWMVNNGTQIVGPLSANEIAQRLFAQDLDFDCECWVEGAGFRKQIRNSGVFSGSDDEGAHFWIYDGETVHGPVREGFLKTALLHDAIPEESYLCEGSTVNGWKSIAEWKKSMMALLPGKQAA